MWSPLWLWWWRVCLCHQRIDAVTCYDNNNRLLLVSHLIRAWSAYKDIQICSFYHSHTPTPTPTHPPHPPTTHHHHHHQPTTHTHACTYTHTHTHTHTTSLSCLQVQGVKPITFYPNQCPSAAMNACDSQGLEIPGAAMSQENPRQDSKGP